MGGKVYDFFSVQSGKVPEISDYAAVISKFLELLNASTVLTLGALYGSGANPTLRTRRTILHTVVAYRTGDERRVRSELRVVMGFAREVHVPLIVHVLDEYVLEHALHSFAPLVNDHLKRVSHVGGTLKGVMYPKLRTWQLPHTEVLLYLSRLYDFLHTRGLEYADLTDIDRAEYLTVTTSAPLQVARRVLAFLNYNPCPFSADEVIAQYVECMPKALTAQLRKLHEVDEVYTEVLLEQYERANLPAYRKVIARLERSAWETEAYVHATMRWFTSQ
jgi:hypothetical protein